MVGGIGATAQQALLDGAIYQLYRAIVLQQHARSNIGYRGVQFARHAVDALQQLVLLWAQPRIFCGNVAEMKKPPKLKTEFSEPLKLFDTQIRGL